LTSNKFYMEIQLEKRENNMIIDNILDEMKDNTEERAKISNIFKEQLDLINMSPLKPLEIEILQVNFGKKCNQQCVHCHVEAGPNRHEMISRKILEYCVDVSKNRSIKTIDITGGAPEMNPHLKWFISKISELDKEILVRTNLTILQEEDYHDFIPFYKKKRVTLIASLPCYIEDNVDQQRGHGTFKKSIQSLKELNEIGYGEENSDLNLHLVYNPGEPSLPAPQSVLQQDHKRELWDRYKIKFNKLYTITNIPIGRYKKHLEKTNMLEKYYDILIKSFNPTAAENVMCRNTVSVDWQGFLYDCDFNQMLDLKIGGENPIKIDNFNLEDLKNRKIIVKNHCFGCTAGSGSSCQGSIA
jgi:radical SAM/Cys-rich protein